MRIATPFKNEDIDRLHSGDKVLLSGVVYTARDAAHARLVELIKQGKSLPIELAGQVIYYVGPTPSPPGRVIGSAGPTTSCRMDAYAPLLMEAGLKGMIGKGQRDQSVIDAIVEHKAVYFAATPGAGALLARHVTSCEVVAYEDLGCEAIHKLTVDDLPLIVINDSRGRDFYRENQAKYVRLDAAKGAC